MESCWTTTNTIHISRRSTAALKTRSVALWSENERKSPWWGVAIQDNIHSHNNISLGLSEWHTFRKMTGWVSLYNTETAQSGEWFTLQQGRSFLAGGRDRTETWAVSTMRPGGGSDKWEVENSPLLPSIAGNVGRRLYLLSVGRGDMDGLVGQVIKSHQERTE